MKRHPRPWRNLAFAFLYVAEALSILATFGQWNAALPLRFARWAARRDIQRMKRKECR